MMLPLKHANDQKKQASPATSSHDHIIDTIDLIDDSELDHDNDNDVQPREFLNLGLYLGLPSTASSSNKATQCGLDKDAMVAHLLTMFPELCPNHAASCLDLFPDNIPTHQVLLTIVDYYLIHGITEVDFTTLTDLTNVPPPNNNSFSYTDTGISSVKASTSSSSDDAFHSKEPPPEAGIPYFHWCLFQMASDFPLVKMVDLRQSLKAHNGRLGPAYQAVYESCSLHRFLKEKKAVMSSVPYVDNDGEEKSKWPPKEGLQLMKCPRPALKDPPVMPCPIFEKEWQVVQKTFRKIDTPLDQQCNYKENSCDQEIECGCCYSDCKFEDMVQCADGHLFCTGCLRRHIEERTFGSAQSNDFLPCIDTGGCMEFFPWSEVKRALPTEVLLKYDQRQAEEAVARAKLQGLVYCPFCNRPWEMDLGMLVLECPNEACGKSSCIKCKEQSHVPLRCEEVEKISETSIRKHVEEAMTKAFIRECSACKAEIIKTDGCNRVACRCGQNMCYVCRKPIDANYKHFCQHTREAGKLCKKCNQCSLWEKEVEDITIKTAKETALKNIVKMDPNFVKRRIGPPSGV